MFFICFVIFAIIKSAATGAKAAYRTVFTPEGGGSSDTEENPNNPTPQQKAVVASVIAVIDTSLRESYDPKQWNLSPAVLRMIPTVTQILLNNNYPLSQAEIKDLILSLIPKVSVHVPEDQLYEATKNLSRRV